MVLYMHELSVSNDKTELYEVHSTAVYNMYSI